MQTVDFVAGDPSNDAPTYIPTCRLYQVLSNRKLLRLRVPVWLEPAGALRNQNHHGEAAKAITANLCLRHPHFSPSRVSRPKTTKRPLAMAPPRPRLLYSAVFAWLSVTGGRFFAPFLEHEASFSDEIVGSVLATQCAVSALLGSAGGTWADARERRFPGQGRAQVMFIGVSVGSISFLLQGVHHLLPLSLFITPEWHFVLRIAWASSLSLVMPVLDGMTLAHLEKAEGMETSDYGKERLFGKICVACVACRKESISAKERNSVASPTLSITT